MNRILTLTAGLIFTTALLPAHAVAGKVPALDCHQPTPPPKAHPTKDEVDAYNKALPEYRKCIQQYVSARSADATKYSELAQENAKAANAAIKAFNDFVKKVDGK